MPWRRSAPCASNDWARVRQATQAAAAMRSSSAASHQVRVLPMLMPVAPMRRASTSGRAAR